MVDTPPEIFSGRISTVTYDDGAGFRIVKISQDGSGGLVTAKGHFVGQNITPGTWVCFEGQYTVHPTYGKQVTVIRSPVVPDRWNDQRVLSILTAQGIGPGVRGLLVGHAASSGKSILETLESDNLPGDLVHASERWKATKAHLYAAAFLASAGIPGPVIDRVWKKFSTDVEQILTKDPWALVQIEGITFAQADEVATKLGVPLTAPQRISGAVLSVMKTASTEGHLYATMHGILEAVLPTVPNATDQSIAQSVKALVQDGALILDRTTRQGVIAIYDPSVYTVEATSADMLLDRLNVKQTKDLRAGFGRMGPKATAAVESGSDLHTVVREALSDWASGSGVSLTEDQSRAALSALTDNVCLVTGLPGTGKTTALRAVVSCLKDAGVGFLLVAPTGIAAKRLSNVVNAPAYTIHRAFGAKGRYGEDDGREVAYEGFLGEADTKKSNTGGLDETWGYCPGNPHPADVVIVDETSMVDMHMLHRILGGTRPDCRLVFVGDPYQLPSVGAGDVLGDLVESKVFPHTHLDRIFRQEDTSGIVLAAHAVHKGITPNSDGKDFVLVPAATELEASELVLRLTQTLYDKRANFQVLSPRHSGEAGVTNLNDRIRAQLNPPQTGMAETRIGGSVVREGDRIMVVKNDYQKGVYNGDVGTVRRIDRTAKEIEASVFGLPGTPSTLVRFPLNEAAKTLRLAYAQTVHKCVHPDTLVWHAGGLHRAGDLPDTGEISTPDGVRRYCDKVEYPEGDLLKITTQAGYSIQVTPEHGIDVWNRDLGQYVRTEAQDIRKGDWLCLSPTPSSQPGPDYLPLTDLTLNSKTPKVAKKLDEDMAEFIGIVAATASVRIHLMKIHFGRWDAYNRRSVGRSDIAESVNHFSKLCFRLFQRNPQKLYKDDRPYLMKFRIKGVLRWLWENFPELFNGQGHRVPKLILTSNKSVRRAFLRGYFLQVMSRHVVFDDHTSPIEALWVKTRSQDADNAIRLMLLDEGITCRSTVRGNLTIRGRDLQRFFTKIGFSHPDSNRLALQNYLDFPGDHPVPVTASEGSIIAGDARFTKLASDRAIQSMPSLAGRTRFYHDFVRCVELVRGPSVCVTVPDTHRFIQNGFCGWNSQGQEYDVIIVPVLASFGRQLQRNLLYTAITRARKKVLIIGQASAVAKAVQNDSAEHRRTLLAFRLRGAQSAA